MPERKMSLIVEFASVPLGTGSTSLSGYVSEACRVVEASGLPYRITPMGTIIEAPSFREAMGVIARAHEALFEVGATRVSTIIKVDDRRDKKRRMGDKVQALRSRKLQ
jgi:uncharacterized protein (TIGR00106 family)